MPTPKFYRDAAGNYLGAFDGAQPPAGAVEVLSPPADARQVFSGGAWQPLPPPPYRQRRKDAYAQQLGKDAGDYLNTIGDVLDVLIAQVEAMRVAAGVNPTAEYAAMLTKIAAIKAANPAS